MTYLVAALWMVTVSGCGDDSGRDAGRADATVSDASDMDASSVDAAGDGGSGDASAVDAGPLIEVTLLNQGGTMEGHTPRGFSGMGTGLLVGDNINPSFPEGDGVQLFLSFDLSALPAGRVVSAVLSSTHAHVSGTPFADLGELRADEVRYDRFSRALFDLMPVADGGSCLFAATSSGPFSCDLTPIVASARADARGFAQMRMRFDVAGDSDGRADLVSFFVTDANTDEAGIFELVVTVAP